MERNENRGTNRHGRRFDEEFKRDAVVCFSSMECNVSPNQFRSLSSSGLPRCFTRDPADPEYRLARAEESYVSDAVDFQLSLFPDRGPRALMALAVRDPGSLGLLIN